MPFSTDSRSNRLIAALPECERQRWLPQLEAVDLEFGQVLHESRCPPTHAYFPTRALVGLLYGTAAGGSTEIAVVGNEGIVGAALFMGGMTTPGRAVVQSAGRAWRMKAQDLRDAFDRAAPVRQLLLRYVEVLITQIAQTAVCSRLHSLDQRLCRWLLLSLDHLPGSELVTTQESIANLLGVRRESVTEGALRLQCAGLIRHSRGHITVLDRAGLERRSCECYAVVRKEYERLMPLAATAQSGRPHHAAAPKAFEELASAI